MISEIRIYSVIRILMRISWV